MVSGVSSSRALHIVSWMMRFICANLVSRVCIRVRGPRLTGSMLAWGGPMGCSPDSKTHVQTFEATLGLGLRVPTPLETTANPENFNPEHLRVTGPKA